MINFREARSILLTTIACLLCAGTPVLGENTSIKNCGQKPKEEQVECVYDNQTLIYEQGQKIRKELGKIKENQGSSPPLLENSYNPSDLVQTALLVLTIYFGMRDKHKAKTLKKTLQETVDILTQGSPESISRVLEQKFENDDHHSENLACEVFEALKKADTNHLAQAWARYWIANENSPPYEECSSGQKVFLKIAAALFCRAIGRDYFHNGKSDPLDNEKEAQTLAKFINYYKNSKSDELEEAFNNLFKLFKKTTGEKPRRLLLSKT
jgi:hypothetical protein